MTVTITILICDLLCALEQFKIIKVCVCTSVYVCVLSLFFTLPSLKIPICMLFYFPDIIFIQSNFILTYTFLNRMLYLYRE